MTYEVFRQAFREGWRPALGWVAVLAAFHEFVLKFYLVPASGDPVQLAAFVALVVAQIGVRAWEKAKGAADAPG